MTRTFVSLICVAFAWVSSAIAQQQLHSIYEPRVFHDLPVRVMKPLGFDAKRSYPVIVSLHGGGGRGTDNKKQIKDWNRQLAETKRRKDFPCYVVAPQSKDLWNGDHLDKIKALIESLPSVDQDRIYVLGHSMGGHGTYILIQIDPEYFAAAAPSAGSGLKKTEEFIDAEKIQDIPIWAFHGDEDRVCPYEKDRRVFDEVGKLNGNMKLTTWAGDNHGVSGKMIPGAGNGTTEFCGDRCNIEPDFMTWLFSQSRKLAEFDQQAREVQGVLDRLEKTPGLERTKREAKYLQRTISSIYALRDLHGAKLALPTDASDSRRQQIIADTEKLRSQIEADEELVEMIARTIESDEDEVEDTEAEIAELRVELEQLRAKSFPAEKKQPDAKPSSQNGVLKSGTFFIKQSWSQEQNFQRPYIVNVPNTTDAASRLPVFIFLHGNGGNAKEAMQGWLRNRRQITSRYITVFAQGYRESWNIVSERSKADDVGFIESIVKRLAEYPNVSTDDFTIMGNSNGAALVNQLAIESRLPNIRNYISGVSPLNAWQHDGKNFKAKGDDNNYRRATKPMTGKRLMNISGTQDKLVPYTGGPSKVIPAKDGKLAFLHAEESTFLWAKAMGYQGKRLIQPNHVAGKLSVFRYLDGDVIHYRIGEGHGATGAVNESQLLDFLNGSP